MVIRLLASGTRPPEWIRLGYEEYARRMPRECRLELGEVALERRAANASPDVTRRREGERLLAAVPAGSLVVALDAGGREWSTEELSSQLQRWMARGGDVALLVGGPDGLADDCLAKADQVWSLSQLTFPHQLVRVIVAEQLYRAWTVLNGHPYHRGH